MTFATETAADSPLLWFRLNETSGTAAVNSGSAGTTVNGTYGGTVTLNQAALMLDGEAGNKSVTFAGGYIAVPYSPTLSAFTFEWYGRAPSAPNGTAYQPLIELDTNFQLAWDTGDPLFPAGPYAMMRSFGVWYRLGFGGPIAGNTKVHLAASFDGATFRSFKDGTPVDSVAIGGPADSPGYDLSIGRAFYGGSASYFTGGMDEVVVYGAALDPLRIAAHGLISQGSTPPAVPGQVTGVSVTALSSTTLRVAWTDLTSPAETAYYLERAPNVGTSPGAWTPLAGPLAANTVQYDDNAVAANTTMWYRVRAYNAGGYGAYSAAASGTTPPVTSQLAVLSATVTLDFNSGGVRVDLGDDGNNNANGFLEYQQEGASAWLRRPMFRARHPAAAGYYHLLGNLPGTLTHNTLYRVRVTINDADGIQATGGTVPVTFNGAAVTAAAVETLSGTQIRLTTAAGTVRTKNDNISTPAALWATATHFVRADGADTNLGTSFTAGGAWRTWDKALASAPSGAVVGFGPGTFAASGRTRTTPITLVAQFSALDDLGNEINTAQQTRLEPALDTTTNNTGVLGPTGGGTFLQNAWTLVPITGPNTLNTYSVWRATSPITIGGDPNNLHSLVWSATRTGDVYRIPIYMGMGVSLDRSIEFMFENTLYNYGAHVSGEDIYLRLPPNAPSSDPNTLFVTVTPLSVQSVFQGNGTRVCGFHMRAHNVQAVTTNTAANNFVVDHNYMNGCLGGASFDGAYPSGYGSGHVVQYNVIRNRGVRAVNGGSTVGMIPWDMIKASGVSDAYGGSFSRIFADSVENGCGGGSHHSIVFRYNICDGPFNGFGAWNGPDTLPTSGGRWDRFAGSNWAIHGNTFRNISDDCIEIEPDSMLCRVWGNRVEYVCVFVSLAPGNYGPILLHDNVVWRCGVDGMAQPASVAAIIFKLEQNTAQPWVEVYNNTFWSDTWSRFDQASGVETWPAFRLRNNIVRLGNRAFTWTGARATYWDEDYNWWSSFNMDTSSGMRYGTTYRTAADVAAYRAQPQLTVPAHTNRAGGVDYAPIDSTTVDAQLVNPVLGDLRLKASSIFLGLGVQEPGVRDAVAPDLGYATSGVTTGSRVIPATAVISVSGAAAVLTGIVPVSAAAGSGGLTLVCTGTGFTASTKVTWNGAVRTTTYVSPTRVDAAIAAGDLASPGTATVNVQ